MLRTRIFVPVSSGTGQIKYSSNPKKWKVAVIRMVRDKPKLESFYDGEVMKANFNENGKLNFNSNWNPQDQNSDLGVRFEVGFCFLTILMIFSSRLTFYQFPGGDFLVVNISYCLRHYSLIWVT